jgi:pimeloyl-ACP methyl ester carboxylesterase
MNTQSNEAFTSALRIAYEQTGPNSGETIILLHGFPYDVREFDQVRDLIASDNRRIIVPYLRGFGGTRYASQTTFRSGQQAALGKDIIDLLDFLKVERAILVGYDWGGRGACVAAALWPNRIRALVSIGGYTIQNIAKSAKTTQAADRVKQHWYQWYFQTEQGRLGLQQNRDELCELMWRTWSPSWDFDHSLFETSARSFHNEDFVHTVIHSYRHRHQNAPGDPGLEALEAALAKEPAIACSTIVLHGDNDQVEPVSTSEGQEHHFTGHYERRVLPQVGHCAPAEAPAAVRQAIEDVLSY